MDNNVKTQVKFPIFAVLYSLLLTGLIVFSLDSLSSFMIVQEEWSVFYVIVFAVPIMATIVAIISSLAARKGADVPRKVFRASACILLGVALLVFLFFAYYLANTILAGNSDGWAGLGIAVGIVALMMTVPPIALNIAAIALTRPPRISQS